MKRTNLNSNVFIMKMTVIISGLILEIGGMIMIFFDFQAEGSIQIKSPIFEGNINATYIGLFVIFMGMVLQAVAILKKYQFTESPRSVKTKDYEYSNGGGGGEEEE